MITINRSVLGVFRLAEPIKSKLSIIRSILSTAEGDNIILAILTLANTFRWSSASLNALREQLTVVPIINSQEGVGEILVKVISSEKISGIITEEAFEILTYLLSPLSSGFNRDSLGDILNENFMTPSSALAILEIHTDVKTVEQKPVLICGCCGRGMASTSETTGLCSSCSKVLGLFTKYRRGPFDVPINRFNFPRLSSQNKNEVLLLHDDYIITKEANTIKFRHNPEFKGELDLLLPFEEFSRRIHKA